MEETIAAREFKMKNMFWLLLLVGPCLLPAQ
jgi:hypothetical protein